MKYFIEVSHSNLRGGIGILDFQYKKGNFMTNFFILEEKGQLGVQIQKGNFTIDYYIQLKKRRLEVSIERNHSLTN